MSAAGRRPVLIVVHQLGYGGVSNAVLDQAAMFSEAGHATTILTLTADPDLPRLDALRESGRLGAGVGVRNVHLDHEERWRGQPEVPDPTGAHALRRSPGLLVERGEDHTSCYERWFDPYGGYVAFARIREDGTLSTLARNRDRVGVAHERFDGDGRVVRANEVSSAGHKTRELFFAPGGHLYAQRLAHPKTGAGRGVAVSLPGEAGPRTEKFAGLPQWHISWLRGVLDEFEAPVVLAETPTTIPKVARARRGRDETVLGMLHNNQFAEPFSVGSPLRHDHLAVFDLLDRLDGLVVLTEAQRRDVVDLGAGADRVHVVPNMTARVDSTPSVDAKDPRLVSVVSRLAPQKALHEAVRAFSLVRAEIPDARLEIYGRGPSADGLAALVAELGLGASVMLMGRTSEPLAVMKRSVCTVSTSDWEAMPLSILESAAAGTPVVAYDCLYGPAALIEDGVDGRLVPRGDRESLARAVVALLRDPEGAVRMGRAAQEKVRARYGREQVLARWTQVMDAVSGEGSSADGAVSGPVSRPANRA
ncbi:glycosyltransferase [Luteimicrobium xylanilyticum]|uniref:Poly(Glycerol-phosphate) alpha-glucosyltransferase n=1 Tax=Luteimicrobium xylanilyticum TaxID=1133546 RepID=A0A5P9QCB0_9MICO|nr:glycosyltransferase [Luteimicrobium xylanilyticum]QFU99093.1 Poly(glycerol-phosphate) alpha-glucosyltransferase [Luteimicrobium xylanilyticum]